MRRFFDPHAILGLLKGEPAYEPFVGALGFTHPMNVLAAMTTLLRAGDSNPRATVDRLALAVVREADDDLFAAARLKARPPSAKAKFSCIDALGYSIARRTSLPFLTGDPGFFGLAGVDFVRRDA